MMRARTLTGLILLVATTGAVSWASCCWNALHRLSASGQWSGVWGLRVTRSWGRNVQLFTMANHHRSLTCGALRD